VCTCGVSCCTWKAEGTRWGSSPTNSRLIPWMSTSMPSSFAAIGASALATEKPWTNENHGTRTHNDTWCKGAVRSSLTASCKSWQQQQQQQQGHYRRVHEDVGCTDSPSLGAHAIAVKVTQTQDTGGGGDPPTDCTSSRDCSPTPPAVTTVGACVQTLVGVGVRLTMGVDDSRSILVDGWAGSCKLCLSTFASLDSLVANRRNSWKKDKVEDI
jgi:hypothetical protein